MFPASQPQHYGDLMAKRKTKIGACVYCGKNLPLTKDHIPPKNLYAKPRPSNLITVPCCKKCNTQASKDDEYFRLNIIMRDKSEGVSEAESLQDTVFRGLNRKEAGGLKKDLINRIDIKSSFTPLGIFTGLRNVYDVDLSRLDRVAKRTIAGIIFKDFGHRLPDTFDIAVFSMSGLNNITLPDRENLKSEIDVLLQEPYNFIGNESVFAFWRKYSGEDMYTSLWLLVFFRSTFFVAIVSPKKA